MRWALVGNHPDGLAMASALAATGRHEIALYCGSSAGLEQLRGQGLQPRSVGDLEEVLADPSVEAVIVGGSPSVRAAQLRRALQSERHVVCVYPPDKNPDTAYEAALIQGDTRRILLPLLTLFFHPAVARLAAVAEPIQLLEVEWSATTETRGALDVAGGATVAGWDVLRRIGGEIAEVFAYVRGVELTLAEPAVVAGSFEKDGIFEMRFLPNQQSDRCTLVLHTQSGKVRLEMPAGWQGASRLIREGAQGSAQEENWDHWTPWPALVAAFEEGVAGRESGSATRSTRWPTWDDAIRGLELDDAARRSAERRRASTLEYQEATEEATFKGTMTLVGCSMLWGMLLLLVLSRWVPALGWPILPLLVVFLALQFLRWVVPRRQAPDKGH